MLFLEHKYVKSALIGKIEKNYQKGFFTNIKKNSSKIKLQFLHLDPDHRLGYSSNSNQCGSGFTTLRDRAASVYLLSGDGSADLPALVVDLAQPQVGENKREIEVCAAPKHKEHSCQKIHSYVDQKVCFKQCYGSDYRWSSIKKV
jgi:hypothetical protein